ncbi:MAG: YkgJ family cysteine cluster protein [Candidatus Electrothrix sp. GW3-4]|uniref:YkgJ family cysteine cluster protein n=1 Tax=Candidatus Electrothrix sp. GW3-4 TaxID=3126740 RepID=UPI0030CC9EF9
METTNPCLTCGACCAFYRASFYWAETASGTPGGVPDHLTEKMNDFRAQMKGMKGPTPRCIAMTGEIGKSVCCSIYEQRASVCRNFPPSLLDGVLNERCDRARLAHGLKPLTPEDWGVEDFPRAA